MSPCLKDMPNPNPCERTRFKTDREESCTAHLSLRITPSQKAKLKNIDGWQEEARQFLDLLIERQEKRSA